jgi:hypothetical protein
LAVRSLEMQNLSMLYAMLRNPSFTSAMLIPIVRRITSPARWCMAPNICSILERVLALVRFPCFSHEVNGCPLQPFLCRCARNLPSFRFASLFAERYALSAYLNGFLGGCLGSIVADLLVAVNGENRVVVFKFYFAGFAVHFFAFRLRGLLPPLVFKATRKFRCRP